MAACYCANVLEGANAAVRCVYKYRYQLQYYLSFGLPPLVFFFCFLVCERDLAANDRRKCVRLDAMKTYTKT